MALRDILTTLVGRLFGLDVDGNPVWNRKDGSQLLIEMDSGTGEPSITTTTPATEGAVTQTFPMGDGAYTITVTLDEDGTDVVPSLQVAHDRLLARGGGILTVKPRRTSVKPTWGSTLFNDPRVKLVLPGKGLAAFKVAANFPLANYTYRNTTTGVVANSPILQRCCIYVIPYAPFDPTGQVITPSSEGVIAYYEGFTIDGNKTQQSAEVFGIYAPPGKTDPNWPFVAGAYSQNQVTNPGGSINLSADAQAYYGYTARQVEIFNTSGTQFYAGADRQRTHLLEEVKGTLGGVNNPDGTALYLARGYDIQGNDGWVMGGGWGNNNGASQGSGESGMLRVLNNYFPPKGTDAASISVRDEAVNGSMSVGNVINTLARLEVAAANPIKARGGGYVGNNFLWGGSMQSSGPNAGRPTGVTSDEGDTFLQFQGYEQTVAVGNVFSVNTDGSTPKFHVSATQGAGVLAWNPATTNSDGSQSYRGTTPWFTDNTLGVIGGGWLDPIPGGTGSPVLHIAVSWKGLLAGPNLANTQFVQIDSPLIAAAGIVGRADGTAPPAGFVGEPGASNGTVTLVNNTAADATTLVLAAPGEYDLYMDTQFVATTATTAAATAYFEASMSTTANSLDTSSARVYAGMALAIPTGLSAQPLVSLQRGPQRVSLSSTMSNATYHGVVKGSAIGANAAITGAVVLHSRRL